MKQVPNCRVCKDRQTCRVPCEALKKSLQKVTRGGRELNIGVPIYLKNEWPDPAIARKKRSPQAIKGYNRDYVLVVLDKMKVPRHIISQVLGMNIKTLRFRICRSRRRLGLIPQRNDLERT